MCPSRLFWGFRQCSVAHELCKSLVVADANLTLLLELCLVLDQPHKVLRMLPHVNSFVFATFANVLKICRGGSRNKLSVLDKLGGKAN